MLVLLMLGQSKARWNINTPLSVTFFVLAVPVGTPIYGNITSQPTGYTSDVVAFGGRQQGNLIQIVMPDGELQWIDGRVIQPFGTAHPGHTCFVFRPDGVHPQFVIH